VLDGDPAPPMERGIAASLYFSAHFALARSPISAAAGHLLCVIICCHAQRLL